MGAYLSKGGKSFICMSSAVRDKKTGELKSRIRPTLVDGSVVTATRTNLQYLVTEYGKFSVKGKSTWERAEGLISSPCGDISPKGGDFWLRVLFALIIFWQALTGRFPPRSSSRANGNAFRYYGKWSRFFHFPIMKTLRTGEFFRLSAIFYAFL